MFLSLLGQTQALWSLYQVTVPTPLRLPPTSQRLDPSMMVMSAASGSLPAAHAFLHNKNASILLPLVLSSCPSPACHKGLCSPFPVSAETQGCPRAKARVGGGRWAGIEWLLDSHRPFSRRIEATKAQRRERTRGDIESMAEVQVGLSFSVAWSHLLASMRLHSLELLNLVITLYLFFFKYLSLSFFFLFLS